MALLNPPKHGVAAVQILVTIMRVLSMCTFSVLYGFDNGDRACTQTENLKTRYANATLPYQTVDASSHSTG
jgi:hypothetical protein